MLVQFVYERGEGRYKHRWKKDEAGFIPSRRGAVGKCHRSITDEVATALLRTGIVAPSPYGDDPTWPDQVFNAYRGVPYVAVPTRPGISYHGYPWKGRMDPSVRQALRQRAEKLGCLGEFERWMREHESE